MPTYLITGGAGFIGSNMVDELLRRGETVRVIDNLSTGLAENLAGARNRIDFYEADIRDLEKIRPYFEGADYVIHLAALASIPRSIADPITSNAVNVDGTLNVLVAARDAKAQRVVFAASSSAYGDNPVLPRVETHEPRPLSPYALMKLTGEYYCKVFTNIYGLETVSLRYFNIFGPRQNPNSPYTGVLSLFNAAYIRGATPTVYGDGEQSRDFTYVSNVVDASLRACTAAGASGGVYNIGVGEQHSINQVIAMMNKIFGREVKPKYAPARQGDVRESLANISRAREVLGYKPIVSFEDGLRRTVEWYRATLESK
ncbi:MAG TPA: SDR family oxidoreductase [Terriglobia bacterium]|nr:SDR family oxidoreductase [Terriglobia bacterium]